MNPLLLLKGADDPPRTAAVDADDRVDAVGDFLPKCQTAGKPDADNDSYFRM